MNPIPHNPTQDEQHLGELAMKFRATRDEGERRDLARDYSLTVERLIHRGEWHEIPPPEDQLPDAWMPAAFFEYWSGQHDTP